MISPILFLQSPFTRLWCMQHAACSMHVDWCCEKHSSTFCCRGPDSDPKSAFSVECWWFPRWNESPTLCHYPESWLNPDPLSTINHNYDDAYAWGWATLLLRTLYYQIISCYLVKFFFSIQCCLYKNFFFQTFCTALRGPYISYMFFHTHVKDFESSTAFLCAWLSTARNFHSQRVVSLWQVAGGQNWQAAAPLPKHICE